MSNLAATFKSGFKLNHEKCLFLVDTGDNLGFTIKEIKEVSNKKLESIKNYPAPKSIKTIKISSSSWFL